MNIKLPILAALIIALGMASCKKGNDVATVPLNTSINVVNASGDTINIYVNGTRINNINSLYPMGSSDYLTVTTGTQNYQFKKAGTPNALFSLPLTLDTAKTYTLFVAGTTADNTFLSADLIPDFPDTVAVVRFVHTSAGAGSLDARVGGGDSTKYLARTYKSISGYQRVFPGIKNVRIFKAGTTTAVIDTTRTFSAGKAYTIFTNGAFTGARGNTAGIGLTTNN